VQYKQASMIAVKRTNPSVRSSTLRRNLSTTKWIPNRPIVNRKRQSSKTLSAAWLPWVVALDVFRASLPGAAGANGISLSAAMISSRLYPARPESGPSLALQLDLRSDLLSALALFVGYDNRVADFHRVKTECLRQNILTAILQLQRICALIHCASWRRPALCVARNSKAIRCGSNMN